MGRVVHIIGNGPKASLYQKEQRKGLKMTCNLPPFAIPDVYATAMVDFKMMNAITKGEVEVPGEWVVGYRPKIWMDKHPSFYMQRSAQIKEFYLTLPKYVANYTDFNCGHMCTHYSCTKFKPDEIHMYGFDSMFDMDLRSCTDFYLESPRDPSTNVRLSNNWRPIWQGIFREFSNIKFVLHHDHPDIKFPVPDNVEIKTYGNKAK
jgi:hypothetical protein